MTSQQLLDEYANLPVEARHQVEDFVAFLRQRYQTAAPAAIARPLALENEPFIGMWRDQSDTSDSSAWVRQTRRAEWGDGA
jgi:hypothetical protein